MALCQAAAPVTRLHVADSPNVGSSLLYAATTLRCGIVSLCFGEEHWEFPLFIIDDRDDHIPNSNLTVNGKCLRSVSVGNEFRLGQQQYHGFADGASVSTRLLANFGFSQPTVLWIGRYLALSGVIG